MKLLVLNGPNLNLLGLREPTIYGTENYAALVEKIQKYCDEKGVEVSFYQSNHEGCLVDQIQQSYQSVDGIVFNPGAYTHTSIALLDALNAVGIPTVEVHISDMEKREEFRRISYVRSACIASVIGHGTDGYLEAVDILLQRGRDV